MGAVKIDIYKSERKFEQLYPLDTTKGVKAFLRNIHYIREARFLQGEFDACVMLIDFENLLEKVDFSEQQRKVLFYIVELDLTYEEVGSRLDIAKNTVATHFKQAIKKIVKEVKNKGVEHHDQ